jgi:hypothetical protein
LGPPAHAQTGDFGRPKPSVWSSEILPFVGDRLARSRGEPVSRFPWTDDEREWRDLAWGLLEPPHDAHPAPGTMAEWRRQRILRNDYPAFDRTVCARDLLGTSMRSSGTRYRLIIEASETDRARIAPFFALAERVFVMDAAREKSLLAIPDVTPGEFAEAMARVAENRMLHGWVHRRLGERVACYRFALERLAIATPMPQVVEVERAILALEEDIRQIRRIAQAPAPRGPAKGGERFFPTTEKPNLK